MLLLTHGLERPPLSMAPICSLVVTLVSPSFTPQIPFAIITLFRPLYTGSS